MNNPLLLTTGALLFGALNIATPNEATADVRVRIGGGVSVGSRWHRPTYRPYYRPRYSVGGSVWVGQTYPRYYYGYRTYAAPPPPPPACDCGPGGVPSYYPGYYASSSPAYTPVAAAQEPLPRWGIGGFAGGTDIDEQSGSDVGLMGRLRLTDGLLVEMELGASKMDEQPNSEEDRFAAGLIYEFGARNAWAPYVVGSLGGAQLRDNSDVQRSFGEIGVGLRWALTDHLHLAFDIRAGAQKYEINEGGDYAARISTPLPTVDDNTDQSYSRARLSALLYF